jgi:sulfite reductase (ferredoxin)
VRALPDRRHRPDGTRSESFLVPLGGGRGEDGSFGRKAKGVRIFAEDAADYVETLLTRYRRRRNGHASFAAFVHSLTDAQLAEFARWDR